MSKAVSVSVLLFALAPFPSAGRSAAAPPVPDRRELARAAAPPAAGSEEGAAPAGGGQEGAPPEGGERPPGSGDAGAPAAAGPSAVPGMIRGTVYGAGRKPIAGLMVQLSSRGEGGLLRVTGTNERGEYVFADLPAGVYDVEVGADGRRQRKESIAVRPPFRNIVDFEIGPAAAGSAPAIGRLAAKPGAARARPPGGAGPAGEAPAPVAVRGRFVDRDKRPIAEVSVTLVPLQGGAMFQTFSGADGAFLVEGVPPGAYRLLVASPGHVALDLKSVEVAPVQGLELSLSLVDYPLNFRDRRGEAPPRETPRQAPPREPEADDGAAPGRARSGVLRPPYPLFLRTA